MRASDPFPNAPEPRIVLLRRLHAAQRQNHQMQRILSHTMAELNAARGAVNELLVILDSAGVTRPPGAAV